MEKKEIVSYIFQGLKAEVAFQISGITKHQYYYQKKKTKQGRVCSINTFYTDSYGQKRKFPMILLPKKTSSPGFRHRLWLSKNENCITNQGYNINHKKVYRLMKKLNCYRKNIKTF
jgi:hypothetical protein